MAERHYSGPLLGAEDVVILHIEEQTLREVLVSQKGHTSLVLAAEKAAVGDTQASNAAFEEAVVDAKRCWANDRQQLCRRVGFMADDLPYLIRYPGHEERMRKLEADLVAEVMRWRDD